MNAAGRQVIWAFLHLKVLLVLCFVCILLILLHREYAESSTSSCLVDCCGMLEYCTVELLTILLFSV